VLVEIKQTLLEQLCFSSPLRGREAMEVVKGTVQGAFGCTFCPPSLAPPALPASVPCPFLCNERTPSNKIILERRQLVTLIVFQLGRPTYNNTWYKLLGAFLKEEHRSGYCFPTPAVRKGTHCCGGHGSGSGQADASQCWGSAQCSTVAV